MRGRPAFTLVELLVVVTLIVVLLAMLTPALDKAIAITERVVCMSNQKQVAGLIFYYQGDNKRYFPYGLQESPADLPAQSISGTGLEPGWANARPPQALLGV